jgi:uncharacterized protein YukE
MTLAYPVDHPDVARSVAGSWRNARATLGEAGAALDRQTSFLAAAWQGGAAQAAIGHVGRNGSKLAEAATTLDEAAAALDAYANALGDARNDIDRLNAEAMEAADVTQAVVGPDEGRVLEELADTMSSVRRRHQVVMTRLQTTADSLGQRLLDLAARATPGWVDPDAGPAAVVRHNAGDTGEVDWVTHLALTHPNLTAEQRLWILEHRDRFVEELGFLLDAASNPAVTEKVAANDAETGRPVAGRPVRPTQSLEAPVSIARRNVRTTYTGTISRR